MEKKTINDTINVYEKPEMDVIQFQAEGSILAPILATSGDNPEFELDPEETGTWG